MDEPNEQWDSRARMRAESPASLEGSDIEGEIDALLEELGMDGGGSPVAQVAAPAAPQERSGQGSGPRGLIAGSQRPPSPITSPTRGDRQRDEWKGFRAGASATASGAVPSTPGAFERDEDRPDFSTAASPPAAPSSPHHPTPPPPRHRGKSPGNVSPGAAAGAPGGGRSPTRDSAAAAGAQGSEGGPGSPAPPSSGPAAPAGSPGASASLLSSPWVPLPARAGRLERLSAAHAHHWHSGLDARARGAYAVSEEAQRILRGSGLATAEVDSLLRSLCRGPSSLVAAGTTASHPVRKALGKALAQEQDAEGPVRFALSAFARRAPPHEALALAATLASVLEWPYAVALRRLRAQGGGLVGKSADGVCDDVAPLLPPAHDAATAPLAAALGDMWAAWRVRWAQRRGELGSTDRAVKWLRPTAAPPASSASSRQRALQSMDEDERGRVEAGRRGRRGRRGRKAKTGVIGAIMSLFRSSARTEPGPSSPSTSPSSADPSPSLPAVGMAEAVDEWQAAWAASAAWQCPAWGKLMGALAQDLEREDADPAAALRQLRASVARLGMVAPGAYPFLFPPRARATLAQLWLRSSCAPHRIRCTVSRGAPLRDVELALRREGVLGDSQGRGADTSGRGTLQGQGGEGLAAAAATARAAFFVPLFRASHDDGGGGGGAEGALEQGEGHGLRKELFAGAAGDAATPWSAWEEELGVRASTEEGRSVVTLDGDAPSTLAPGTQVTLRREGSTMPPVTRRVASLLGAARFAVDRQLPETAAGWTVTVRQPRQAVLQFHRPSESLWVAPLRRGGAEGGAAAAAEALGFIMGSAALNRCTVPLRLAPPAWEVLAHGLDAWRPCVVDLLLFDPAIRSSLAAAVGADAETLGALCAGEGVEGKPDAARYLAHAAETTLREEPLPVLGALCAGFHRALPLPLIRRLHLDGADLCRLVCGEAPDGLGALLAGGEPQAGAAELRVQEYFLVAADPACEAAQPLGRALWAAVDGLDADGKRQFLHFVTGVDSLPAPGTEVRRAHACLLYPASLTLPLQVLRIDLPYTALDVEEHCNMLRMLPTAHVRAAVAGVRSVPRG